jgi:hypothetical protein
MLYVSPVPVGAETVIVPATEQVGWVTATVADAGAVGCELITATVAMEIQPLAFLTVTL